MFIQLARFFLLLFDKTFVICNMQIDYPNDSYSFTLEEPFILLILIIHIIIRGFKKVISIPTIYIFNI